MLYEQINTLNGMSYKLERFSWTVKNKVANCRCDICGDSEKNKLKRRMYFYVKADTLKVKCQNCGFSDSFLFYLKEYHKTEFQQYKLAMLTYKRSSGEFKATPKEEEYSSDTSYLTKIKTISLEGHATLDKLPEDHPAVVYYNSRKLPKNQMSKIVYTDDFSAFIVKYFGQEERGRIPKDPRLVFFMRSADGETIHYAQGRAIDPNCDLRYSTVTINEGGTKVWGLEYLNTDAPPLAFEGVLDALFFENGIAVCGGDFASLRGVIPNNTIIVCDNEPRHKDTIKRLYSAIEAGFTVAFWPSTITQKDPNNMILDGLSIDYIKENITKYALSGARAKARFMMWKKI